MSIKYRAEFSLYPRILKQEIDRESIKSIFIGGRATKKETHRYKYFNSFREAKSYLLEGAKECLARVEGMEES